MPAMTGRCLTQGDGGDSLAKISGCATVRKVSSFHPRFWPVTLFYSQPMPDDHAPYYPGLMLPPGYTFYKGKNDQTAP